MTYTGTAHDADAAWDAYAAAWDDVVESGGDPGEWDPTAGEDPANLWHAGEPEDLGER